MSLNNELEKLNSIIQPVLQDSSNQISIDICDYLMSKSKKIRPKLLFLFAKALGIHISDEIYNLAVGVEFIHNSTLIHDDILDDAKMRRNKISLNYKLGNNLSILAGDILLTKALYMLSKCKNIKIINIFSDCMYNMCKGEINQHFSIDKLMSIDEYIQKSEYKTSELFKATLLSLSVLENIQQKDEIENFARNFGIAFQIKDDLLNILNYDTSKPYLSDIKNGIFTATVIYLNEDKKIADMSKDDIISQVQNKKYIKKTIDLIKKYALNAIKSIEFMGDNQFKQEITEMSENLYKAGINE